jgi:outer membrane immunogenic protein
VKRILAVIIVFMSICPALAGDLAGPIYQPSAVVSQVYDWSGLYVGAIGGYARATGGTAGANASFNGGFGGGTVGYNAQISNLVAGVEVEGSGSRIGQTISLGAGVSVFDRINAFGSATARLGVALDNFLVYGKGGYAVGQNELGATAGGVTASETRVHGGYAIGAGLEYGVTRNISVKAEYMRYHFQSQNYLSTVFVGGLPSGTLDLDTGKIGVNFRF